MIPNAKRRQATLGFAIVVLAATPAFGQWVDQSFPLQSGWNTIFLEVDPADDSADAVFVTDPAVIVQVWTRRPSAIESVLDDTGSGLTVADSSWRVWVPPGDPARAVDSLTAVRGGEVYLIEASDAATLTIRGIPSPSQTPWEKGFNVVGFHVNPAAPPTFQKYLAPSAAHATAQVFKLNADGTLVKVTDPGTAAIEAGRGYWVSSSGRTVYDGPLAMDPTSLHGLAYGEHNVERNLDFENLAAEPRTITLTVVPSVGPPPSDPDLPANAGLIPMKWRNYEATREGGPLYTLDPLDEAHALSFPVAAASTTTPELARKVLRVSVARQGMGSAKVRSGGRGSQYEGVLIIDDGEGYQRMVAISAEVPGLAGLYAGTVTVDHVAWVQADARIVTDPDEDNGYENPDITDSTDQDPAGTTGPRPTVNPFIFPVLVHYDGLSTYKCLREVTLLFEPGATGEPGRYVLATPDCGSPCDALEAGSIIDGERFRRRMATAAFSFEQDLTLTGSFETNLAGTTDVGTNSVLNPYRHPYHPNHDGDRPGEILGVTRTFAFVFSGAPPPEFDFACSAEADPWESPGEGDRLLEGFYYEILSGLHKRDIRVCGTFELRRISTIPALNDVQKGGNSR